MSFLLKLAVNAAALYLATRFIDGISYRGSTLGLFGVALIFGLINATIKPVMKIVSIPAILITVGLFLLVINAAMLLATSAVAGYVGLGFHVRDFGAAFWGSLLISVVSMILNSIVADNEKR